MKKKKPNKPAVNEFVKYSGLAFEMMAIIAGSSFLGYKIDQKMGNDFLGFTLGLSILGVVMAILYGIRDLLKK